MNFEKLMNRYDQMVVENRKLQQDLQEVKSINASLLTQIDSLRRGNVETHAQVANRLVREGWGLDQTIDLIKEVRRQMGWGLKESKDVVDALIKEKPSPEISSKAIFLSLLSELHQNCSPREMIEHVTYRAHGMCRNGEFSFEMLGKVIDEAMCY